MEGLRSFKYLLVTSANALLGVEGEEIKGRKPSGETILPLVAHMM